MQSLAKLNLQRKLTLPVAAVLTALTLGFAPPGPTKSFRASFATTFDSVVSFPIANITVAGAGQALHMGATTAVTTNQTVNFITGQGLATYTLTAANGDTIVLDLDAATTFLPTGVAYAGTYVITGGTGRFDGAGGTGSIFGTATFTGPTNGIGTFAVDGTLTK